MVQREREGKEKDSTAASSPGKRKEGELNVRAKQHKGEASKHGIKGKNTIIKRPFFTFQLRKGLSSVVTVVL